MTEAFTIRPLNKQVLEKKDETPTATHQSLSLTRIWIRKTELVIHYDLQKTSLHACHRGGSEMSPIPCIKYLQYLDHDMQKDGPQKLQE